MLPANSLREQLDTIDVRVTPETAAALMAAPLPLASRSNGCRGDYRDHLATLGRELFESRP